MKNRYEIIKSLYPNYLILIKKKNKYFTFNIDKNILKYINYKKNKDLEKKNINYLILDNLDIIKTTDYKEKNKYYTYLIKSSIIINIESRLLNEKENNCS
jgi:hypothetical protein